MSLLYQMLIPSTSLVHDKLYVIVVMSLCKKHNASHPPLIALLRGTQTPLLVIFCPWGCEVIDVQQTNCWSHDRNTELLIRTASGSHANLTNFESQTDIFEHANM
jgi:hypothetical protein